MVQKGDKVPTAGPLTENSPDNTITIPTSGKVLIVGVPGAFTPPCSSQVPGYLENAKSFADAGVAGIYIVAVNDIFCVNAWKDKLADGKPHEIVHFVSDGTGHFTQAMDLLFDASGLLGNHRSKRYVATAVDGVIQKVEVEDEAPNVTVTDAKKILGSI